MAIEFTNGASVHQIWGDLPKGECLASFQYFSDAVDFAAQRAAKEPDNVRLFVLSHRDGESRLIMKAGEPK